MIFEGLTTIAAEDPGWTANTLAKHVPNIRYCYRLRDIGKFPEDVKLLPSMAMGHTLHARIYLEIQKHKPNIITIQKLNDDYDKHPSCFDMEDFVGGTELAERADNVLISTCRYVGEYGSARICYRVLKSRYGMEDFFLDL